MGHLVQIPVEESYHGCYHCENGCYPGREYYEEQHNTEGCKDHPHAVADDRIPERHFGVRSKPPFPLVGIVHVQMMVLKMRPVDGYAEHRLVLNEMDGPGQPQSCEVGGHQNEQEVENGELDVQHWQFPHFPLDGQASRIRRQPPTQNPQRSATWASRCDWQPTSSSLTRVTSAPAKPYLGRTISKTCARSWTETVLSRLDPQRSPTRAARSRTGAQVSVRSECRRRRRRREDGG